MSWTVVFDREGELCTLRSLHGEAEVCSPIPDWTQLQVFTVLPHNAPAWREWTRRHGLDSSRIPIPGWIAVDDTTFRVHADYYALNEHGERYPDPTRSFAVREVVTIQLEGKALPFPGDRPTVDTAKWSVIGGHRVRASISDVGQVTATWDGE